MWLRFKLASTKFKSRVLLLYQPAQFQISLKIEFMLIKLHPTVDEN